MKSLVLAAIMVALVIMPVTAFAQSDQTATTAPPLSQPLVREGTLALKLAEALKVGTPANEAEAESALTAAGIAPKNGWIADYPVTPDIAGELQSSVNDAASAGRIPFNKDAATAAFQDVMTSYNLSVAPGISTPAANAASPPDYPDAEAINNYYYDEGPPVVTYYAPPPDYAYLYSWVPYPFWWWNFWFPGFFVLADFNIGFHGHHGHHDGHHDGHHHGHGDGEFITNHFRDHSGRMTRIDPAHRAHGGTFAERGGDRGWTSPTARSSAQSIVANRSAFTSARRNSVVSSPSSNGISRPYSRGTASVSTAGRRSATTGFGTNSAGTLGSSNISSRRPSAQNAYRTQQTFVPSSGQGRTFSQPSYRAQGNFTRSTGGSSFTPSSGGFRSFSAPSSGGRSGGGSFGGMSGSFSGGGRGGGGGRR